MEFFKKVYEAAGAFYRHLFATEEGRPRIEIASEEIVQRLKKIEITVIKLEKTATTARPGVVISIGKTWAQIVAASGEGVARLIREYYVLKRVYRELTFEASEEAIRNIPLSSFVTAINSNMEEIGGAVTAKVLLRSGNIVITFEEDK